MSAGASGAAGAAAAARRRKQEEEEMTTYNSQDLSNDWEFKILRSMTGAFKDPVRLKQILEQEARCGWMLVEKFDNQRIRLKRPATARKMDSSVDADPYRTYVGLSENQFAFVIVGVVFGSIAILLLLVMIIVSVLR